VGTEYVCHRGSNLHTHNHYTKQAQTCIQRYKHQPSLQSIRRDRCRVEKTRMREEEWIVCGDRAGREDKDRKRGEE
jgi:hypothetical protein